MTVRETVCLVDDDRVTLDILSASLKNFGFGSDMFTTAEAAIAACSTLRYDCVVTDLNMDGMTGLEMIKAFQTQDLDLPIVAISGDADMGRAAKTLGAQSFLEKPVPILRLVDQIESAITLRPRH